MKNLLMSVVITLLATVTTLKPQLAHADNPPQTAAQKAEADAKNAKNMSDLGDILEAAVIVAAILSVDDMPSCGSHEHRNCDRYDDRNKCEYQRVQSTEIMTQCRQYRHYGEFTCETTSTTTYIKSCGRGFDHDYNRDHRH